MQDGKIIIIILNIIYALKYNFTLILLRQLFKSEILYHNYLNCSSEKNNTLRIAVILWACVSHVPVTGHDI